MPQDKAQPASETSNSTPFKGRGRLRDTFSWLIRSLLRLRVKGTHQIPDTGGVILLPNHISYLDAIVVQAAVARPVRFLGSGALRRHWWIRLAFWVFDVIPIHPGNPANALREAMDALESGACLCLFPEGRISRDGQLGPLMKGFQMLARKTGAPVVPIHIEGLGRSAFSLNPAKNWTLRDRGSSGVALRIGEPLAPDQATLQQVHDLLLQLKAKGPNE